MSVLQDLEKAMALLGEVRCLEERERTLWHWLELSDRKEQKTAKKVVLEENRLERLKAEPYAFQNAVSVV